MYRYSTSSNYVLPIIYYYYYYYYQSNYLLTEFTNKPQWQHVEVDSIKYNSSNCVLPNIYYYYYYYY